MTSWPPHLNADDFFLRDRLAEGRGDSIALRLDDRSVSYTEVDALANAYAIALTRAGVARGDRVLLVLDDAPAFVAAIFGTFRIGAVVVMINPGVIRESVTATVERSQAAAAIVDSGFLEGFESALTGWRPQVMSPDSIVPSGDRVATTATGPGEPAMWLFSGGTTGVPKAVPQTHQSLVNTTRLYGQGVLGLEESDITISVPKLYFGYATGSNLLFPFSVGASAVLFSEPSTPEGLMARIANHRPTVLIEVPSAINQMLNHPGASREDFGSLRLTTSAGEALPETLYQRWMSTFGVELLDGLGTAEMWHIFVSNRPGQARPGTVGQVVPGFEVKACDDDGNELPNGEVGRLWVRGDSLGLGYWGDPESTADAFRPPWFVGGDLISIDEEGYVTHRGRADDAVKVKGKWFRPQELESTLLDHPAVLECAVVTVEDEVGLTRPVAFVVCKADVTEQELIDWSLSHLEAYKHPRRVFFVEQLPLTHLGKVDRAALRRRARD